MQIILETTSGLERRMRICVPSETLENKVEAKIKQAAGQVQLKGFRKGKVPVREVKRRFGAGIRQEVGAEMMQDSFSEAVRQEAVFPAGTPQIEDISMAAGKDLEFTAIFEVFPEIDRLTFENISVERPTATILDEDIGKMIDTLRDQRTEFVAVERACMNADQVNIDFEGTVNGAVFDGGKAAGNDLVLGSGSMLPGFEDGILGMSAGEEKDIRITFPEDYADEALAGNAAVFKIRLHSVAESVRPALDEAFFKNFGILEGGMEAFRNEVKANMEKELKAAIKTKVKNQVMGGLLECNTIDLPKGLIDQEIDRLRNAAVRRFGSADKIDASIFPAAMFSAQAAKNVKLGLLVNAITKQESLVADADKVKQMIHDMASSYDDPEQVINHYYGDERQLNQVQNLVLEDQVVDTVLVSAVVTDVIQIYEDAVTPASPEVAANETTDAVPETSANGGGKTASTKD